eukprot:g6527.t1
MGMRQFPTKLHIQKSINKDGCVRFSSLRGGKKGGKAKGKGNTSRPTDPVWTQRQGPDREKHTEIGEACVLSWALSEMRGWRPAMEDRFDQQEEYFNKFVEDATCVCTQLADQLTNFALFAVFDGHGGSVVSRYAARELPSAVQASAMEDCLDEQDRIDVPRLLGRILKL